MSVRNIEMNKFFEFLTTLDMVSKTMPGIVHHSAVGQVVLQLYFHFVNELLVLIVHNSMDTAMISR